MHKFDIQVSNIAEVVSSIKEKMTKNGYHFEGDKKEGHFKGAGIEGCYTVKGKNVCIQIDKKPFIVPMSLVESKFKEYFK